jgi:thiol:disulfide interchange protein DsbD
MRQRNLRAAFHSGLPIVLMLLALGLTASGAAAPGGAAASDASSPEAKAAARAAAKAAAEKDRAELARAVLNYSALQPGMDGFVAVVLDIKPGFHAQSHTPTNEDYEAFLVTLNKHPALDFGEPIYPPPHFEEYPALGRLSVYTDKVIVRVPVKVKPDAPAGPLKITGSVYYQVCDDKVCFQPVTTPFEIDTTVVQAGRGGTAPAAQEQEIFGEAEKRGVAPIQVGGFALAQDAYLLAFALAFLVGIIFNVMPCVLPVVPLKAIGFYEVSQHNRGKSIAFGLVFSLGLVASFAVLGLLVVALRVFDWGELFTKVWFRVTIVLILVGMAISTFGFFSVNLPTGIYRFTPRHDTYVGNFLFGILTAALSTPCTFGMFVGLLTWALSQPAWLGMAAITTVGAGMASPYLVLSAFPELARRFPRSGPWAELVKQLMGFLLLGAAVYFARPFIETPFKSAANKHLASDVFWWTLFGVVAVAAIFLVVRTLKFARSATPRVVAVVIALLMVVPTGYLVWRLTYHPHDWRPIEQYAWQTSAQAAETARETNQIHLVEFTADWCGNCQWVEAWVLNSLGIVGEVKQNGVVMVKADVTNEGDTGRLLLGELNPSGAIPLTALYAPGMDKPIVLTGIYSKADLRRAIEEAARQRAPTTQGTVVASQDQ